MNKTELLDTLRAERRRLDDLLARLDEDALLAPGVQGDWSVRDLVAHLAVWEQRGTEWLRALARGQTPQAPAPGCTWRDVHDLNADTFEEAQWRALGDVLAEFQAGFAPLLEAVQSLPDEVLRTEYCGAWTGDEPRFGWQIVAWRCQHYRSHGRFIAEYAAELRARR